MCDNQDLNLKRDIDLRIFKQLFIIIFSLLVFAGCVTSENKTRISKAPVLDKNLQVKKNLPNCINDIKIMNYAVSYVLNEFEKGYFQKEDILGAKAQLFLIKNKSKSVFAQNIIKAEKSYNIQYLELKKKNCSIDKFSVSPLQKIKNKIKELDANNETIISK